ncbi:MAG: AsmA family protein [Alphaproteobacteria bacterium]
MKRVAVILLAVIGVLLVAALVIPFFISTDVYKDRIQTAAKEATGRELVLGGDVKLSLLPPVRLRVENVSFDNAEWASADTMAEMKSLSIGIDPFAYLFGGKVKITEFVLRDPVINLEVAPDGRANWDFSPAQKAPEAAEADKEGGMALNDIMLGDIRLVNGLVTYSDRATGETQRAENITATVSLPSLDGPLKADGGLRYNAEDIDLDLRLDKPRAFLNGETSDLDLGLKSSLMKMSVDGAMAGNLDGKGLPAQGSGAMELDVPSMRKLAAWFESELPAGKGYGPLSVKGQATASGNTVSLNDASLRVDEIKGNGDMSVDLGGARPVVKGQLVTNQIDLKPYQSTTAVGQAEQATSGAATGAEPAEGWSDEPIDFGALKLADADLRLTADGIDTGTLKTGKARVDVSLVNGLLKADLRELGLYEGGGTAYFEIDARNRVPAIRNRMNFDAVKSLPLLRDLTGMGVLEGVGDFRLDVTSRGRSQREIVQALNGTGSLNLNDGALYGINLARMVRKVDAAIGGFFGENGVNPMQAPNMIQALQDVNNVVADLESGGGEAQKTDFAEFGGTFRFENGVFRNDDMLLLNPLLRVNGNGTSNLLQRTVDYTVTPKLVGTLKGQGGESSLSGIGIPIRVSGTWDRLVYSLDSRALVKSLLGKSGGPLGGALGGGEDSSPGDAIRGLLGGDRKSGEDTQGDGAGTEGERSGPGGLLDSLRGREKQPAEEEGTADQPADGSGDQPADGSGADPAAEEETEEEPKPEEMIRGLLGGGEETEPEEEPAAEEENGDTGEEGASEEDGSGEDDGSGGGN